MLSQLALRAAWTGGHGPGAGFGPSAGLMSSDAVVSRGDGWRRAKPERLAKQLSDHNESWSRCAGRSAAGSVRRR